MANVSVYEQRYAVNRHETREKILKILTRVAANIAMIGARVQDALVANCCHPSPLCTQLTASTCSGLILRQLMKIKIKATILLATLYRALLSAIAPMRS